MVSEAAKTVYDSREQTQGLKLVYGPKHLRFVQARFEPIA
jgi:tyrosine phenol-lyase